MKIKEIQEATGMSQSEIVKKIYISSHSAFRLGINYRGDLVEVYEVYDVDNECIAYIEWEYLPDETIKEIFNIKTD